MNSNLELEVSDIIGTQRVINEAQQRLDEKLAAFVVRNAGAKVGDIVDARTAYSGKDAKAEVVSIRATVSKFHKDVITLTYNCKTIKQAKGSGVRSGIDATVSEYFKIGELNKEVA